MGGDGTIFVVSGGAGETFDGVFAINPRNGEALLVVGGAPFSELGGHITVAPNGDLVLSDVGAGAIWRIDPALGNVNAFLTAGELQAVVGGPPALHGGSWRSRASRPRWISAWG